MSRTYRRKNQEQAFWIVKQRRLEHEHPNAPTNRHYFDHYLPSIPKGKDPYQVWLKKVFHSDKSFAMRNPGWWNRLYGTKPLRAKNREHCHKVLKLIDLEDAPVFYKRMRVPYYW